MKIRGISDENYWDFENGFYWFSDKTRLNKLLAHYEIYKMIHNIPGHIFEFGVYKATSLIRFATFRNSLENDYSRKIVGFDIFGSFPVDNLTLKEDLQFVEKFEDAGGEGLDLEEVENIFNAKGFENIELVKGNIFDTLPSFIEQNHETRIALLHMDVDVKEPTDFILENLYERVVPGGIIIFDNYNSFPGESISVDNLMKKYNLELKKLPFYNVPSFIVKPN